MQKINTADHTKRKKLLHLGIVNLILLLLIVISLVIVFNVAVLTTENTQSDKVLCITANAPSYSERITSPTVITQAPSGLNISDRDGTWQTNAEINLFEHNDPRVKSDGTGTADHVIAPGTSNDYVFTLQNDKNENVRYQLEISGGNDSEYQIPVSLSIIDPDGKNLLGNEPVMIADLDSITQIGTLSGNSEKNYTIKWDWDFENGTDDYDTLLGNTAVSEEIPCHINLNVVAEYDDSPSAHGSDHESDGESSSAGGNGEPSQTTSGDSTSGSDNNGSGEGSGTVLTGDSTNSIMYAFVSALALTAIILMFVINKKQKKNDRL